MTPLLPSTIELLTRKKKDMQTAETPVHATSMGHASVAHDRAATEAPTLLAHYQIIRRNGAVVPFEPSKIAVAMMKAFWRCTAHKALHPLAFVRWSKH